MDSLYHYFGKHTGNPLVVLPTGCGTRGLKRYFTGEPCKAGHVAERRTAYGTCVECESERRRKRYEENREAVLERRFSCQLAGTDGPQVLDGDRAETRCLARQPVAQARFGVVHHRGDVPQGVIEVEGDQLEAHSLSLPLRRLARGWALS